MVNQHITNRKISWSTSTSQTGRLSLTKDLLKRAIEKFQTKGSIKDGRDKNKRRSLGDGDVTRIKQQFETNPKASVSKASVDLNISKSSLPRKLKKR